MRPIRALTLVLAFLALTPAARAQELNCTVTVNYSLLQGNEYQFLGELRDQIERYLNGRSWTEDVFDDRERIDCGFQVTLTEAAGLSRFTATLVVTSSRPIYGTSQRTNVLALSDNAWQFSYNRGQGLLYNPTRYDPLTSVLDYYALLILGYDYDTFSELGGQPYFERARAIAEVARAANDLAWFAVGNDYSRGNLAQQLLDTRFEPLRRAYLAYHLGVLDRFTTAHEEAWVQALAVVQTVHGLYTEVNARRHVTDVFFDTKGPELADLLADAPRRAEAYELLVEMDPTHQTAYDRLVN